MNKRHYEHTLPNIRGSLSNTYVTIILCWKSTTYMLRETDCPAYYTWTGTWMGLSCWKGNIKNMDVRTS